MPQPDGNRRPILWRAQTIALNLSFWTVMPLLSVIYGVLAVSFVATVNYTLRNPRLTKRLIRRGISYYGGLVCRCGWPFVRVRFVDSDPGSAMPCVFVANHRSMSDGFLMSYLPLECVQVLNIWPAHMPVMGSLALSAEYLRVREMPFDEFLEAGAKLLSAGVCVIAFPEGTRSGSRTMGNFHGSSFRLAQHCGVDIVPIAIAGNEDIPHKGSLVMHPGRITFTKLPAIRQAEYAKMSPYQLKNLARDRIREHLDALEQQQGAK
jgi:1-acyl-sn-glycerol-3-phosphate acyltransferase